MPIKFMPFVREAITNAPMSDPITVPTPPAADTPAAEASAMARAVPSLGIRMNTSFKTKIIRFPSVFEAKPRKIHSAGIESGLSDLDRLELLQTLPLFRSSLY